MKMLPFCKPLPIMALALGTALMAGCAGEVSKGKGRYELLASLRLERNLQAPANDCPVGVTISNRTDTDWDGASYHVAMLDRRGKTIGSLIGSPHKHTAAGRDMKDTGQVLGGRCTDIASAALVYFGYYPAGKRQVSLHNSKVRVELK